MPATAAARSKRKKRGTPGPALRTGCRGVAARGRRRPPPLPEPRKTEWQLGFLGQPADSTVLIRPKMPDSRRMQSDADRRSGAPRSCRPSQGALGRAHAVKRAGLQAQAGAQRAGPPGRANRAEQTKVGRADGSAKHSKHI